MTTTGVLDAARAVIESFAAGDRQAIGAALGRDYFSYRPRPDEPTALAWIESLRLEPATRAAVREPIVAVEAGLRESLRRRARDGVAAAAPTPPPR